MKHTVGRKYRGNMSRIIYTLIHIDPAFKNAYVLRGADGHVISTDAAGLVNCYELIPDTRDVTRWGVLRSEGEVVCTYEDEPAARAAAKRYDYPYVVKLTGSYEV